MKYKEVVKKDLAKGQAKDDLFAYRLTLYLTHFIMHLIVSVVPHQCCEWFGLAMLQRCLFYSIAKYPSLPTIHRRIDKAYSSSIILGRHPQELPYVVLLEGTQL